MAAQDTSITSEKPHRVENPYFGCVSRGPYLLGHLLSEMPVIRWPNKKYEPEVYLQAAAAEQHASNGINTLLYGIDAIGALMVTASLNDEYGVEKSQITAVGELISHLAVELQFLREVESNMHHIVESQNQFMP